MSFPVVSRAEMVREVAGTKTTDLNGGSLHLFTAVAGGVVNPVAPVTQFTEASYTGYAPIVVAAWSAPFLDVNGIPSTAMPSQAFFGPAGGVGGANVLGAYYTNSADTVGFNFAALFDSPANLMDPLSLLVVSAQLNEATSGWVSTEGSNLP